jgi:hypothetical protein
MNKLGLICFDVDGTLLTKEMEGMGEYVEGIIPTSLLLELEEKGWDIAIVSPSPFLPAIYANDDHWFCKEGSTEYRIHNINEAIAFCNARLNSTSTIIYVDDLKGNRNTITKQSGGFIRCMSPEFFMEWVKNIQ